MKIESENFGNITYVAKLIGEKRNTLNSAIKIGLVEHVTFPCGVVLVEIKSAQAWAKSERRRGRPKASEQTKRKASQ